MIVTIKSYTDIEQSRKLAEILPLESADYCWGIDDETLHYNNSPYPCAWKDYTCKEYYIPCWSLAALFSILHDYTLQTNTDGTVFVVCESKKPMISDACDNPVDACYEMILKLNELKML